MTDFERINQQIDDTIRNNGVKAITGTILNGILKAMLQAVADNLPSMYSEDIEYESARIRSSLIILEGESISMHTDGCSIEIDGNSFNFNSNDGNVVFHIGGDGLYIELSKLFALEFNVRNGFKVQLNDGDPYIMTFDVLNGLQFGSVNVESRLDNLQRQIDELKNQ